MEGPEDRLLDRGETLCVEVVAQVVAHRLPQGALEGGRGVALHPTLIARPAEVLDGRARARLRETVDLLPVPAAHVADVDVAVVRVLREAERVAEPVRDDPSRIGIRRGVQRVVRSAVAGARVDP